MVRMGVNMSSRATEIPAPQRSYNGGHHMTHHWGGRNKTALLHAQVV
jgi:hypothetical protein